MFPRRTALTPTDALAWVGDPPLPGFGPNTAEIEAIHVSVAFTWDVREARRLAEAWRAVRPGLPVEMGGPALGSPAADFEPGLYVRRGVVFTSRGCNNRCAYCLVPQREGRLRVLEPIADGWIVQDNNFLQTPKEHRRRVYKMLARQRAGAIFSGGLEARRLTPEIAAEFRDLRLQDVFLAADTRSALVHLERAVSRLSFLPAYKIRCYVLVGYGGETIGEAEARLRRVYEIGAYPFAQLYQPPDRWIDYPADWRDLARVWSRPALEKAVMGGPILTPSDTGL